MPKAQNIMYPDGGGEPLPRTPLVGPWMSLKMEAERYVQVLERELELEHNNQPKWRGQQRSRIKKLLCDWRNKAAGKDEHYQKHGTFRRPLQAGPPGLNDLVVETWKRREMDKGTWVSNKEHRRKVIRAGDAEKAIIRARQKKYGTKTVEKPKE